MYTIDTSVFARDFDTRDPEHAICRALLEHLASTATPVFVPLLVLAEVAATISRERRDPIAARLAIDALRAQNHIHFIILDNALAQATAELAADQALRGADALFVAVAQQYTSTLISLDREQRARGARVVTALTPAEVLAALTATP